MGNAVEDGMIRVLPLFGEKTVFRYREIAYPDRFWLLRHVTKEKVCLVHDVTRGPPNTWSIRHLISWDEFEQQFDRVEVAVLPKEESSNVEEAELSGERRSRD